MKSDPILVSKTLPAGEGRKHPHTFRVEGGLHYLKGNDAPYFALIYTEHRQGFPSQEESGGCNPDSILQHFPQFADLAALHLSDINGVPTHAESNGWYQLAGALGGFGEEYHAGNSKQNFPLPASRIDPAKPWQTTEHRLPTREECLESFARHCRIPIEEAQAIVAEVDLLNWQRGNHWERRRREDPGHVATYLANCRTRWAAICESMRPRWQAEANACILRHRLQVYGDPWAGPVPACLSTQPPAGEVACEPEPEQTYIDRWGITSTATPADRNPNMDGGREMDHWRVVLRLERRKMTTYFSLGSGHGGREPTAQEVIDCIARDAASVDSARSFEEWAQDSGYNPDSRKAHKTFMICRRQGERLQKFLGVDHYAELMGGGG